MNRRNSDLLVLDLETTGTNPFRHDIIALACVPFRDEVPALEIYVRHENVTWSDYARDQFSKYVSEWSLKAVSPREACEFLEQYLTLHYPDKSVTLLGHNVGFDVAFLRKLAFEGGREEIAGISHRALDTHTLLYVLYRQGRIPASALSSSGAFNHFGIVVHESKRHTALGDALATRALASELFEMLDEMGRGI